VRCRDGKRRGKKTKLEGQKGEMRAKKTKLEGQKGEMREKKREKKALSFSLSGRLCRRRYVVS
jgi:hypothetical protein